MTSDTMTFGRKVILPREIRDKKIIEIGSYDVNGSYASFMESYEPSEYVKVDMSPCNHTHHKPCVTHVLDCVNLLDSFEPEEFDYVISTEMLEHAEHWKKCISVMKQLAKKGGYIVITTRAPGFPLHSFPDDWWRFTMDDMTKIFADCEILALEPEIDQPGVFIKVKKPLDFVECSLDNIEVHSMK